MLEGWGSSLLFCFYCFKNNTRKQNKQCAALVWGKNRDAKNHRSVERGGLQKTEVARNGLIVKSVNAFMIGV